MKGLIDMASGLVKSPDDRPFGNLQDLGGFALCRASVPSEIEYVSFVRGQGINGGMKLGPSLKGIGLGGMIRLIPKHPARCASVRVMLGCVSFGAKVVSGQVDERSPYLRGGQAEELSGGLRSNL